MLKPTTIPLPRNLHMLMKRIAKREKITVSEAYQRALTSYIAAEQKAA